MAAANPRTTLMLDKLTPSAKIVDGILIITLPDAIRPVVWQMEMGLSKSSGMEVREQPDGTFTLMLKTARQDVQEIAPYQTREQAVRALLTVSKALEGAQGRLRVANANNPYHLPAVIPAAALPSTPAGTKGMRIAIGIIVLLGIMFLFNRLTPPSSNTAGLASEQAAPTAAPTGEPLSAEDYLNAP